MLFNGLCHCLQQFDWNRHCSFEGMRFFLMLCEFSMMHENAYSRPFLGLLAILG